VKGYLVNDEQFFKELTKKYFGFLSQEYNFGYFEDQNMFDSKAVRIYVEQFDRRLPTISLWLKSEPKFTQITIDWLLEDQINYFEMDKYLLEDCMAYYSKVFRKFSDQLIYKLEILLLPGLKKLLVSLVRSENLTKNNYLSNLSKEASKYYYYIKKKDSKWDLRKYL
jgi:hypothetical protein